MDHAMYASMLIAALAAAAEPAPKKPPTTAEVIKEAPASDWRELDPQNTLYLELASGRVVIELAPEFAPKHAANIRTLAHEHYFDGLAIIRSQDNYVVQWGDAEEDEAKRKPLGTAQKTLKAEFTRPAKDLKFTKLRDGDVYAKEVGFAGGFAAARDPEKGAAWMTHCYGALGVGRDMGADSGGGTELYVVIGHAPRHLDKNITLAGRVVQGMELLSTLPRGTGPLGFYEKAEQRVPIQHVRLAADVPEAERVKLEVLRTDSASFGKLMEARRNRREEWFLDPVGHVEVCNVPIPVRAKS
jgi:peptidylprolyl isomerase